MTTDPLCLITLWCLFPLQSIRSWRAVRADLRGTGLRALRCLVGATLPVLPSVARDVILPIRDALSLDGIEGSATAPPAVDAAGATGSSTGLGASIGARTGAVPSVAGAAADAAAMFASPRHLSSAGAGGGATAAASTIGTLSGVNAGGVLSLLQNYHPGAVTLIVAAEGATSLVSPAALDVIRGPGGAAAAGLVPQYTSLTHYKWV
jgi:hypothetical protein